MFLALTWMQTLCLPAGHLHVDVKTHHEFHVDKAELILSCKTCLSTGSPSQLRSTHFSSYWAKNFAERLLSLTALIEAVNKPCWLHLHNVPRIWPLFMASIAVIWATVISCLNLMIRSSFWYVRRSGADIESTAWRKLNHSDWEFRRIFPSF